MRYLLLILLIFNCGCSYIKNKPIKNDYNECYNACLDNLGYCSTCDCAPLICGQTYDNEEYSRDKAACFSICYKKIGS